MNRKVWEVDFKVVGPISIANEINFRQEKGFDQHQFYSDISFKKSSYGLKATITAYADNLYIAETVAYVYFGRMLDVVSLENDLPILLNKHEEGFVYQERVRSRRLLSKSDIIRAFKMARKFEVEQPKLLRAIGWFSKGKITQNTLDKFLAYWSVIEILGKGFHTPTERTKLGVKNKIYQCFIEYFGVVESWDLPEQWIDKIYDKRNEIVHGGADTTIEAINATSEFIPLLEQTSKVLIDKIIECHFNRREFIHLEF